MSYYVRYFTTGTVPTLAEITAAARKVEPDFGLDNVVEGPRPYADITWSGEVFAEIEINTPGQDTYDEDLSEQLDLVRSANGKKKPVLEVMEQATAIVAVRILTSSGDFRNLLDRVDPIWDWLDTTHKGVLAFDSHGFYLDSKLLVKTR